MTQNTDTAFCSEVTVVNVCKKERKHDVSLIHRMQLSLHTLGHKHKDFDHRQNTGFEYGTIKFPFHKVHQQHKSSFTILTAAYHMNCLYHSGLRKVVAIPFFLPELVYFYYI